jgi:MYXO-CTERM domain-containing protein
MKMRYLRSFGLPCAIVAATAILTGCGGQPTDVGESDVGAAIQQDNLQSAGKKTSPLGKAQKPGGPLNALPQNKLLPLDGSARDEFGVSVSIAGNTVVVGSIYDDDLGGDAGSAYVFVEDNGVWTQQAKLMAKDAKPSDYFGISVAIAGDRILVGAAEAANNGVRTGAVYVYERSNKVWSLVQKLTPSTGAASDYFGYAVALEGNVAIIGAPQTDATAFDSGAAYVFRYDGMQWNEQDKIWAATGGTYGFFGGSVALFGTTALIGQWDDGSGQDMGSVFAYKENAGSWVIQEELMASDRDMGDTFGFSVAIYNNKAFIGAPFRDADCANSGAVYVFGRYNEDWCEEQIIVPEDKNASQAFGSSVATWGDMAVVGSYWDEDNGDYSGSAYTYRNIENVWTQQFKYLPDDGVIGQLFGISAAMDGDRVIVGANGDDDNGIDSGAAYQFSVLQDPGNSPIAPQPPVELKDDANDAAGVQCSVGMGSSSSQSPWFVALGIAALGIRRVRRTRTSA